MTASSKTILIGLLFLSVAPLKAVTHEESNWYKIGKVVGSRCKMKARAERDRCCTGGCHKAGAYKKMDLGACKEGCVFYKPKSH